MLKSLNVFRYIPKSMVAIAALFIAVVNTVAVIAAPAVKLEGSTAVANYTNGDTQYSKSVNATYDQVVKFKVYYHNTELAGSGKVAENVSLKVDFPTQPGKTQKVTTSVKGDNTNVVTESATVNLNRDDARLEFIPGSVDWKHNVGTRENIKYETVNIADSYVTGGQYKVIENQKPCFEYEAWITFFARVKVPAVSIDKTVSVNDAPWAESYDAESGDTVKFLLEIKNAGNSPIDDVLIRDILPVGLKLQPGTTKLVDSNNPEGVLLDDSITSVDGMNIGNMPVGTVVYVGFRTTVTDVKELSCGMNTLINKAQVAAGGVHSSEDTASVKVDRECEPDEASYDCEALVTVLDKKNREIKADLTANTSGDVTVTGYSIDFGDGTVVDEQSATHTYSQDGSYDIVGTVTFDVAGETKSVDCIDTVQFESDKPVTPEQPGDKGGQPTTLPNTGPASMIAAIFGAGSVTAAARSYIESRRALKNLVG